MTLRITLSIGMAVAAVAVNEAAVVGLGSTPGDQLVMFRATAGTVPTYELVVSRSDGSALRVLVGRSKRRPVSPRLFGSTSWSPDGERLAFTGFPARFDDPRSDLYTVRADGTGLRRLTRTGRALAPVWSPDGQTIAYAQRSDVVGEGAASATLWVFDLKAARTRQLWPNAPDRLDVPGSWSPDSKRIAFTRALINRESGAARSSIWEVDRDGNHPRTVVADGGTLAWSPDGQSLAFASAIDANGTISYGDRTGPTTELYLSRADGSEPRRLTETRGINEVAPSWSPDGTTIAYQRGRQIDNAEAMAVVIRDASSGAERMLPNAHPDDVWFAQPAWRARSGG